MAGGAVSSFLLTIMAAPLILSWVVQPFAETAKRAEDSLQHALEAAKAQSEELSSALFQLGMHRQLLDQHALVKETNGEGRIVYVNDALCRISGYTREELIGQPASILNSDLHSDEFWWDMNMVTAEGGVWQGEVSCCRKDGSLFWLVQSITAMRNLEGETVGFVDLGTDITENKALHDENMRKNKLASLGQLTATVAHEIRNPLGAIKSSAFVLQRKVKNALGAEAAEKLADVEPQFQRINNGIARCDKIISELLDYTRIKSLDAEAIIFDDWVRLALHEEMKNIPQSVEVVTDLKLGHIEAEFNPEQMRRVLINLISNACEAMVGKGDVPASVTIENPKIRISTSRVRDTIEFNVTDNGPGITPENLAKIREPLFTTKSFGVGLGIPAVEKILEAHHGGLKIESIVGKGTSMTAWFPRAYAEEQKAA
jgi:PAS domain S-box-containing protein